MVPASYLQFFTVSASAGAALIGLLFIAVSISPERNIGKSAPRERRNVAAGSFTALSNAFFISLIAIIPTVDLRWVVFFFSLSSLLGTARSGVQLLRPHGEKRTLLAMTRRLLLPLVSLAVYGLEFLWAYDALKAGRAQTDYGPLAGLLVGTYGLAMTRAWALLGAKADSVLGWVNMLSEDEE